MSDTLRRGGATVRAAEPGTPILRRRGVQLGSLLVIVIVLGTWLVAFSPVLGASTVRVRGNHKLTAAQVRTAAAVPHGEPLIRLDTAAVARRVERLPQVADADVRVSYPHTVTIQVTERVAVAYTASTQGQFWLVDRTGVSYLTVSDAPADLPRLQAPSGQPGAATLHAEASVAAALPGDVLAKIASIQALDPSAITLQLTDQRIVHWGSATRNADKAQVLAVLLGQPGTQIDVSDPDQPFMR